MELGQIKVKSMATASMQLEGTESLKSVHSPDMSTNPWQSLAHTVVTVASQFFANISQKFEAFSNWVSEAVVSNWSAQVPPITIDENSYPSDESMEELNILAFSSLPFREGTVFGSLAVHRYAKVLMNENPNLRIDTSILSGAQLSLSKIAEKYPDQEVFIPLMLNNGGQQYHVCLGVNSRIQTIEYYSPQGTVLEEEKGRLQGRTEPLSSLVQPDSGWTVNSNREVHEGNHSSNGPWISLYMEWKSVNEQADITAISQSISRTIEQEKDYSDSYCERISDAISL